MKKHLTLAAVLGAVAIVGVSFLAQAAPETSAVTTTIEKATTTTTTAPAAPVAPAAADTKMMAAPVAADQMAKDTAECTALASAPKTDGVALTDAEKADALKKCMADKGHKDAAPAAVEGAKEGENKADDVKAEEHH